MLLNDITNLQVRWQDEQTVLPESLRTILEAQELRPVPDDTTPHWRTTVLAFWATLNALRGDGVFHRASVGPFDLDSPEEDTAEGGWP